MFRSRRDVPSIKTLTDVVWIQTAFLGDLVITTAAMSAVRQANPSIRQHLVTTPIGMAAFQGHPWIASLHSLDKRSGNACRSIRRVAVEVCSSLPSGARGVTLQPHKSLRSSVLSRLIGLPTVTFSETVLSCLADRRVDRIAVFHEAHRIALLAESLGIRRERLLATRPWLPPATLPETEWGTAVKQMSVARPLIGIAPGSVWGTKRWPVESFSALARRMMETSRAGIVLLGSPDEKALTSQIELACADFVGHESRLLNLAGRTGLDDLRAVYPMLSLLVSNDSSPIHYASAFNVPTVALFGATIPQMGFGPLADNSVALGVDRLGCRPCGAHGPQVCPLGHFRCMKELAVDSVMAECAKRIPS